MFPNSLTSFLLSFVYKFSSHGRGEVKNQISLTKVDIVEADAVLASTQSFASTFDPVCYILSPTKSCLFPNQISNCLSVQIM